MNTLTRIAMISMHTCPLASEEGKETGGMNVYVLKLSEELAKKGIAVDIFTRSQDTKQPYIVNVLPLLRVIHLKAGPHSPVAKNELLSYLPEFIDNFFQFQKDDMVTYDLIHCHYYLSGMAGLKIKQQGNLLIPVFYTFHTLGLMKNLVAREQTEKEETERISAEFSILRSVDGVIATSSSEKEYLQYLYGGDVKKIFVVFPGVDTKHFKPMDKTEAKEKIHAPKEHKMILFVGRIEPLKGIDSLLYALKILVTKRPHLKTCLWIVGGDISQKTISWSRELQKLEHVRHMLTLTTSVKFVGQRHQQDLPFYYNAAEIVVMPSHYESFGMAALEAMACGVPVITSNVSGIADIFDQKMEQFLTSVNNPLLLSAQMEQLLLDESIHQKASREVYQTVQHFTWEHVASEIVNIYTLLTS